MVSVMAGISENISKLAPPVSSLEVCPSLSHTLTLQSANFNSIHSCKQI